MRIVFFGTSSFASYILKDLLINKDQQVVAIVTRPDRPRGRKLQLSYSPVKECALVSCPEIPLLQPQKASDPDFSPVLQQFNADLFVVVAYGEIIRKHLLDMPKIGCINIHASLLPAFRGAAPMQRALLAGEKKTGITIIEMTPEMDAGDMLARESIPIPEDMNLGEMEEQMKTLAASLLQKVLLEIESKGRLVGQVQDTSLVTFAPKLTAEEERIDWLKPSTVIHNQIRAFSPLPGAWCEIQVGGHSKRLKIKKARVESQLSGAPGAFLQCSPKQGWVIACGVGSIRLLEVQLEGKKQMTVEECLRGFPPGSLIACSNNI